ncbi:MAG: hypothetical protein MI975_28275 [Cytophagales bacterium]|nr:hypothetical protein [Cytophagales bacterium]
MLNKLKKILSTPEWLDNLTTPKNKKASFILAYEKLIIGFLNVENGKWEFSYSQDFKSQDELEPIVDFPDKNKVYVSDELWPFFSSRIPSLNRPSIKETLNKSNIDSTDIVELLKLFGQKTIANPYNLQAA